MPRCQAYVTGLHIVYYTLPRFANLETYHLALRSQVELRFASAFLPKSMAKETPQIFNFKSSTQCTKYHLANPPQSSDFGR